MPAEAQKCTTGISESPIVGSQCTPERVILTVRPRSSTADTCMSPIATQRCGTVPNRRTAGRPAMQVGCSRVYMMCAAAVDNESGVLTASRQSTLVTSSRAGTSRRHQCLSRGRHA
eukprot:6212317-Pleurochrysis_carterae.AAC.2